MRLEYGKSIVLKRVNPDIFNSLGRVNFTYLTTWILHLVEDKRMNLFKKNLPKTRENY